MTNPDASRLGRDADAAYAAALECAPLNAFCHLAEKDAVMAAADAAAARWKEGRPLSPIDGMTVAVKDWFDVAGWPTRYGSRTSDPAPRAEDSPVIAHLRRAGAVFLGKTTLPEYGHKGTCNSPLTGITRNPWNPALSPGGSSGGAAVAAAVGAGRLHLGSDAGGSIRIPAAFCGVFGFKPSPGLVPSWPPSPFSSLSSIGPLTQNAADAARMFDVIAQGWAGDINMVPRQPSRFSARPRIAYARTISGHPVDPVIADIVAAAAKKISAVAEVEEITIDIDGIFETFIRHWMSVANWIAEKMPPHVRAQMDPYFFKWADRGAALSRNDYVSAEQERMLIAQRFRALFAQYDAILTPATAILPFDAAIDVPQRDGRDWDDWTLFTFPANLARLPAAVLPCGLSPSGLPVAVQLMADHLKDDALLCLAGDIEKIFEFDGFIAQNGRDATTTAKEIQCR